MTETIAHEDCAKAGEPNGAAHPDLELAATMAVTSGTDPILPRVLTPEELAKVLRVRRRSVYEAISRGDIPGVRRIGRKVRIDRDSVLAWMADGHGRAPRSSRDMSVRRRTYRDRKTGAATTSWVVDIDLQHSDGRRERIRKTSPAHSFRGAEQYERDLRTSLLAGTYG